VVRESVAAHAEFRPSECRDIGKTVESTMTGLGDLRLGVSGQRGCRARGRSWVSTRRAAKAAADIGYRRVGFWITAVRCWRCSRPPRWSAYEIGKPILAFNVGALSTPLIVTFMARGLRRASSASLPTDDTGPRHRRSRDSARGEIPSTSLPPMSRGVRYKTVNFGGRAISLRFRSLQVAAEPTHEPTQPVDVVRRNSPWSGIRRDRSRARSERRGASAAG
jgi:hypothetical protein